LASSRGWKDGGEVRGRKERKGEGGKKKGVVGQHCHSMVADTARWGKRERKKKKRIFPS